MDCLDAGGLRALASGAGAPWCRHGRGLLPATSVVEFPLEHPDSRPYEIVTGPDGNLWFTESDRGSIGRITPTGTITEFDLPYSGSGPYGITLGADGNLWFTERFQNLIGKITPSGTITEYYLPTENAQPWDITAMPDGTFWFTEENVDQVGWIDHLGNVMEVPDRARPAPDAHHHRPGRQCLVHGGARQQHRPVRPGKPLRPDGVPRSD